MAEFKISGIKSRVFKKELAGLKFSLKHFWYFEDLDRAMDGGLDLLKSIRREIKLGGLGL